jgi:SAM-dependent methyltransferase
MNAIIQKYDLVCQAIEDEYPILAPMWKNAYSHFGDEWLADFITNLEMVFGEIKGNSCSTSLQSAFDGYAEFCNDSLRNQAYFEKHGKYRAGSYKECLENYYHNEEHMMQCYLPGMWLSHYIWPQHYNMLIGFGKRTLLGKVAKANLFYEVGVGCGMYSKFTLQKLPDIQGVGFDISQHALDFTENMVRKFGLDSRYETKNHDISNSITEKCDFLICQEVLEHIEDPELFCTWLYDMIKPGGIAYITAALNAAHSDHIFLFRDPIQLEVMLRKSGFLPMGLQEEFAVGKKPRNLTPSLAGYLCQKPI